MQTLFYILFFSVPLVLWPYTSELFEFNKMVLVYILTVLIMAVWLSRCLAAKRIIFRRTILDIPLLAFLGSQVLSTIFSIDPRTSLLGYYSRFNGGLLSTVCYSLLYWAFVSNMTKRNTLYVIRYTLVSACLVSLYGVAEHFGIDKNLWVQDVQNRVFSTLGQPNWLATWLVGLIPITWALALKRKPLLFYSLTLLLYLALLFTKSRSGFLGFVAADFIFWTGTFLIYKKQVLSQFVICHLSFVILSLVVGFPFSLSLSLIHI